MLHAIKVVENEEGKLLLEGYGIVFGAKDLAGDTFTKSTNLSLDVVPNIPTFYDHNQQEIKGIIGKSVVKKIDDIGVWFQTELDKSNDYIEQVLKLVERGVLGYSTGAVSHLVSKKGGEIIDWALYELSLTATPAEPRTIGIDTVKTEDGVELDTIETVDQEVDIEGVLDTTKGDLQIMSDKQEVDYGAEIKALTDEMAELKATKMNTLPVAGEADSKEVANEVKSLAGFARDGGQGKYEIKALNITAATAGQETVPEGFYGEVVKKIEDANPLHTSVGVRNIPGKGTTVVVPVESNAGGLLTATAESGLAPDYEPTFDQVDMTYVSYRGRVAVTDELLEDNDVNLVEFLSGRFAKMATNTLNNALITEVETNGTSFHTFASATAIAAGEMEQIAGNDTVAPYVEGGQSNWIMRESSKMAVQSITGDRFYVDSNGTDSVGQPMLIGYPVQRSSYTEAIAATQKSALFGNFDYVGFRMADSIQILRDPFSRADYGEIVFHVTLRFVFKVLQADAVGYGVHPI